MPYVRFDITTVELALNMDRFDFCMSMKTFLVLFMAREKAKYFQAFSFVKGHRGP